MKNKEIRKGNVLEELKKLNFKNGEDYAIALGDIASLSEEDWLKWRKHGPHYDDSAHPDYISVTVGGSDTAAICGISPWTPTLQLYNEKIGKETAVKKKENKDAFATGHKYEPYVADTLLSRLLGEDWVKSIDMMDDTTMYRCGQRNDDGSLKYPWALADYDRFAIINGEPYIIEIKTTSSHNFDVIKKWQDGICPEYYEFQVRHYMAVANVDHAIICCAWGFRPEENNYVIIDRDLDIEEDLMAMEENFCMCVETGIEPDMEFQDTGLLMKYYAALYGLPIDNKKEVVELSEVYKEKVTALIDADKAVKKASALLSKANASFEEAEANLIPLLTDTDGKKLYAYAYYNDDETGNHIGIKLKASKKRAAIDEQRFKAEHPAEYEKCLDTSFKMSKLTSLDKEERTHFKNDYLLPEEPTEVPSLSLELKVTKGTATTK